MAQPDRAADWAQLSDPERNAALEVLVHGPLSRSDLARRIGLSPGSLTRLAGSLLQRGILREDEAPHTTTTGRQGRGLRVVTGDHRFIGVRLTGGAVDAVLTDMEATPLATLSKPLATTDPDVVAQTIAEAVAELGSGIPAEGRTVSSLGVGLGGQVAPDGSVLSAVFLGWDNVRLTDRLRELTGVETYLENDVVALTAAEHWFGAGRGRPDLGMLTIGTGIGSGLVMHHKVVSSTDTGVGLLGHLPLGMPGPLCPMGHLGCATAVLTEASLVAQASVALGQPVGLAELFTLADEGRHPAIRRLCADVAIGLGRLVAVIANVAQVPLVIVAGECVPLAALVVDDVRAEIASMRHPAASPVELILHEIGTEEWARGAAVVAIQRFVTDVGERKSQQ